MVRKPPLIQSTSGQAVVEYVILLFVVVSAYLLILQFLNQFQLTETLSSPLTESYAKVYKYGHPKAKGLDEGTTAEFHPRLLNAAHKNRMFINPRGGE